MSVKKIFYNTILQSVGKVVSVAIGLATVAFMTRYLGDEGFGEYTTVISYMGFFGILADLGLYLVTTKEISKEGADEAKILGNIFSLRFITVLSMLTIGALISIFLPYPVVVKQAMFLGILTFTFVSGTQVLVGVFQKHLVFYKLTASEIVQRTIFLLGVLLFIQLELGLIYFVLAMTLANAAHFFISWSLAQRITPFHLRFDMLFWKNILKESWPLGSAVLLNLIYFRADTIILSIFKPAAAVGVYGLSYKILEVLMAFPAMFAGLIMPFLAKYAFKEWKQYKLYLQKSLDAVLLVIAPMIIVTLYFARPIIDLVGGKGFTDADEVLKILIFATALIYLGNIFGYTIVALNAQKKMLWGYATGAVSGLILYLILIPKLSYFGAAIATVAVEFIVLIFLYVITSKKAGFYPSFKIAYKAVLAVIPMSVFFYYIDINWIIEILTGLIFYLVLLFVFRAIPKEFIKNIINART